MSFSPDGRFLLQAVEGGGVKVMDAKTFEEVRVVPAHIRDCFTISPNGRFLAVADRSASGGVVDVWDITTGEKLQTLKGHTGRIISIDFSLDSDTIATCGRIVDASNGQRDNSVRLWYTATGKLKRWLGVHSEVNSVAFHPDGNRLFSAGDAVVGWEIQSGKKEKLKIAWGRMIRFSDSGKHLVTTDWEHLTIYDASSLKKRATLRPTRGQFSFETVAFSRDDRFLAAGNSDLTVSIWDLETQKEVVPVSEPAGIVKAIAVSADGRSIASGGTDRIVRIWDSSTGKQHHEFSGPPYTVADVEFSPDGRMIASSGGGEVRLWDAEKGSVLRVIATGANSLSFSPDGSQLAAGGRGGVRIWDVMTGDEVIRKISADGIRKISADGEVSFVAFSPDGEWLALGTSKGVVQLWNPSTDQFKWEPKRLLGHVHSLRFDSSGSTLAVGVAGEKSVLLDVATGDTVKVPKYEGLIAISPDGSLLATSNFGALQIFDTKTFEALDNWQLGPRLGHISRIVFTPDGRHLVTANGNGTIYVLRLREWSADDRPKTKPP